jgi:hypothetical protein
MEKLKKFMWLFMKTRKLFEGAKLDGNLDNMKLQAHSRKQKHQNFKIPAYHS